MLRKGNNLVELRNRKCRNKPDETFDGSPFRSRGTRWKVEILSCLQHSPRTVDKEERTLTFKQQSRKKIKKKIQRRESRKNIFDVSL